MIEVKHLTKKYGNHVAVSDLNFKIANGKIYGLLGPNGAGKSTTMNIMTGCLAATEGTVNINGFDIFKDSIRAKKAIGYLPEIPPLYPDMTPFEFLSFVAKAKGVPSDQVYRQVGEVIELTQLEEMKNRLIKNLSKGYKQRVGIAQALLGNPEIIILDEPTVGLDPRQIIEIRDLVRKLGQFKTVIISSHILSEIAELCDHVLIISHGHLVANDTLENLQSSHSAVSYVSLSVKGQDDVILGVLEAIDDIVEFTDDFSKPEEEGVRHFRITVRVGTDPRDSIVSSLVHAGCSVLSIGLSESSLEQIFLELTKDPDPVNAPEDTFEQED